MTKADLLARTGVSALREISPRTTVIEFTNGYATPATPLEIRMFRLLEELTRSSA